MSNNSMGKLKAVLGGWDPSDRPFMKTDEVSFTVPVAMHRMMLARWQESNLTAPAWQKVMKKIEHSRKAWRER